VVGGGLKKLLNKVKRGEVKKVVIEYPDRLARLVMSI